MAASATGLVTAPVAVTANTSDTAQIIATYRTRMLYQSCQPAVAITNAVLMNAVHIQNAEQKIPRSDGLSWIRQVTSPLELAGCAADQHVRHIVVQMLVGIAHIGAVQGQ